MSLAYSLGRVFGQLPIGFKIILLGALAYFGLRVFSISETVRHSGVDSQRTQASAPDAQAQARAAEAAKAKRDAEMAAMRARQIAECEGRVDALKSEYRKLVASGKQWNAAVVLKPCATTLNDPALLALVRDAEVPSHLADINDPKSSPGAKILAINMLVRDYPEIGKKYEGRLPALEAAQEARSRAEDIAERKRHGVRIGMTSEEALQSSWGRPQEVNRTITARGTREQWVYGGRSYLYFENGTLTAIQN